MNRREKCYAMIDSGTSGISIPSGHYDSVLGAVTSGLSCQGTLCIDVTAADFPDLIINLTPDNVLPLLATDYLVCTGAPPCAWPSHPLLPPPVTASHLRLSLPAAMVALLQSSGSAK